MFPQKNGVLTILYLDRLAGQDGGQFHLDKSKNGLVLLNKGGGPCTTEVFQILKLNLNFKGGRP